MPKKAKTNFDELKSRVWSQADLLSLEASGGNLPVPLTAIAHKLGVSHIVFDHFLSTAGLEKKHEDRYVVWVNVVGKHWTGPETVDTGAKGLPPLPNWARFTIAHELVHLIFIKAAGPQSRLAQERSATLERACNEIARVILLPSLAVQSAIGSAVLDVDHIVDLIDVAEVSPRVFIWRLPLADTKGVFEGKDGVIACIREIDGQLAVVAHHVIRGGQAAARFALPEDSDRTDPDGLRTLERWGIDAELVTRLSHDEHVVKEREIAAGGDRVLPCVIQARRISGDKRRLLLSIAVQGAPRRRGIFDKVNDRI